MRTIPNKGLRIRNGAHSAPYVAITTPSGGRGSNSRQNSRAKDFLGATLDTRHNLLYYMALLKITIEQPST
jgi:hypothetical protein